MRLVSETASNAAEGSSRRRTYDDDKCERLYSESMKNMTWECNSTRIPFVKFFFIHAFFSHHLWVSHQRSRHRNSRGLAPAHSTHAPAATADVVVPALGPLRDKRSRARSNSGALEVGLRRG